MRRFGGTTGLAVAAALLLAPAVAQGAGFALFEHGARAVAMGGAFAAIADDPTAIYYNPAGLAFQEPGMKFAGGLYLIKPISKFHGVDPYPGSDYTAEQKDQLYNPPHLFLAGAINENVRWGVGVFAPFGLGTWWHDDWAGKFVSKRVDLKVFDVSPNMAFRLTENLAVSVGADYYLVDLDLTKSIPYTNPYTQQQAEIGQAHIYAKQQTGWGYNAALLARLGGGFSLGLAYRSEVKVDATGHGSFVQFPTGYADFDAILASQLPFDTNPTVKSSIKFPDQTRLGLAWQNEDFKVDAEWVKMGWSSFKELPIIFPDHPILTQIRPENYKNSNTYRLGVEYVSSPTWSWEFGGLMDETPVPTASVSPLLPDSDRTGASIGFSWGISPNLRLDVGYLHLWFDKRSTEGKDADNFNGTYKNRAELLGFTLVYAF